MGRKTINVTQETWDRLRRLATPLIGSELGTPEKVIEMLLDEYESNHEPPEEE